MNLILRRPMDVAAASRWCIGELEEVVRAWVPEGVSDTSRKPTVILYPTDYLPVANPMQQDMIDQTVDDVAKTFSIPIKSPEFYLRNVGLYTFVYGFSYKHHGFRKIEPPEKLRTALREQSHAVRMGCRQHHHPRPARRRLPPYKSVQDVAVANDPGGR
ncbi:hypothetical protein PSPO01_03719 [Paraphaeosphaeria sporulosa]